MKLYIICNTDNSVLHIGTSPIGDNPIEIEVDASNQDVLFNPSIYKFIDGQLIKDESGELLSAQKQKDAELNDSCRQAILGGFNHVINGIEYHFSFDTEAQLNFQGSRSLLEGGIVQTIDWTVQRDGVYDRIPVDKALMDELSMVILNHKDGNVRKYRNQLLPLVYEATTVDDVRAITWDTVTA